MFRAKIGLTTEEDGDLALISDLLTRMAQSQADFTNTFRALGSDAARDQFTDPAAFDSWAEGWRARLTREADPVLVMPPVPLIAPEILIMPGLVASCRVSV